MTDDGRLLLAALGREHLRHKVFQALAADWRKRAMDRVPAAYADRGISENYLGQDNIANGLMMAAEELEKTLEANYG